MSIDIIFGANELTSFQEWYNSTQQLGVYMLYYTPCGDILQSLLDWSSLALNTEGNTTAAFLVPKNSHNINRLCLISWEVIGKSE